MRRVEERCLNCPILDELEHAGKQDALELKAALVICVRENKEHILNNAEEVLREERVPNFISRVCEIVDNL